MVLTDVELIFVELALDKLDALGVSSEPSCPLGVERLELALDPTGGFELALLEPFCPLGVERLELAVEPTRGVELALLELPPCRILDAA